MNQPEVRQFVVVPPYAKRGAILASKELLVDYLNRKFPKFDFAVAPFAPVDDDEHFAIIPVIGVVGGDGKSQLCEKPKPWLIEEIAEACAQFDVSNVRRMAS